MSSIALVDSNVLYAWIDGDDEDHVRCRGVLQRHDLRLIIPALAIAEVTYFAGRRLGAKAEAVFLRALSEFEVEAPLPQDWERIAELVEKYSDFPLGGTDASIVALAERLNSDLVITLDRRHFGAIQPKHVAALRLLPE